MFIERQSIEMLIMPFLPFGKMKRFSNTSFSQACPQTYTHIPSSIHREIPGHGVLSARFFGFQRLLKAVVVQRKWEAARYQKPVSTRFLFRSPALWSSFNTDHHWEGEKLAQSQVWFCRDERETPKSEVAIMSLWHVTCFHFPLTLNATDIIHVGLIFCLLTVTPTPS